MNSVFNNECYDLKLASAYIRKWIENQKHVNEESLTDWLLYDVSSKRNRIEYWSFTKKKEAKVTGADWEWWFIFTNYSYGFRVQAKKIKNDYLNYKSITYANKYGLQIDKLINNAIQHKCLPIYAFYTNEIAKVRCGKIVVDEGVYLVGADVLHNKFVLPGKQKLNSKDILKESIPLSCITCCSLLSQKKINEHFDDFIARSFKPKSYNRGRHLTEKLPPHVLSLIEYSGQELPEWWEKEFTRHTGNINGVLMFDFTQ